MAYQTLYRKYRPKSFELVFGQDSIVKTLKNIINKNKLSHAYLFTGPRGTGKTSCAKLFAKAINCSSNNKGDACNNCDQCLSFNSNNNPDIIEIDAASNNGVDEIREIRNKVNLVPSISKYKVYIIDEVHMLSIGAFNALLKTLEEPPKYVIFILATTEPQKLPVTVISRCQRFDFKSISNEEMKKCLDNIISKENIEIEDEAINEIINNSRGGMRDAIGLLDQSFAFCDEKITINDINELAGNISDDQLITLFNHIINKDFISISNQINLFANDGKDFSLIINKMIALIKEGILHKKISDNIIDKKKGIFDRLNIDELYKIMDVLSETFVKIQKSYQKQIMFEIEMIRLTDIISNDDSLKLKCIGESILIEKEKNINNNVPRETSIKTNDNVPRETLTIVDNNEKINQLNELKNIRINNIIKESSKDSINFINDLWDNIKSYLIDEKFKICAGILVESKPVAASSKGIIIALPSESSMNRIEKKYDESKKLIKLIFGNNYKIVYITDEKWNKIRPEYVLKVKNNELELIDEEYLLSKINNNESVSDFTDLIEMEEK